MMRLNTYPLENGTLLLDTGAKPVRVKYHSLCGHFAIIPIMIKRDRFTAADEAKGKKNEKRAYQLTHIPSGRRVGIFRTIGHAQSQYSAIQPAARELGVDLLSVADTPNNRESWKRLQSSFGKYSLLGGLYVDHKKVTNSFPTRVGEKDDKQ